MNFLKKLFGSSKVKGQNKQETETPSQYLRLQLNDKVMPIDRGIYYEDPLDEFLEKHNIGEIAGGGTLQSEIGEIEYCDIEILVNSEVIEPSTIQSIITKVEALGAPKGTKLIVENTGEEFDLGTKEGLGIYLDGINLPAEVYKENDINVLVEGLTKLLAYDPDKLRHWQGAEETGLYFYGVSFEEMKDKTKAYITQHALCQNVRIVQIA